MSALMFLGHYAVGFAAKRAAPQVSLGVLVFAAQFIDLLWPILLLLGLEDARVALPERGVANLEFTFYPISHSLVTTGFWALLVSALYYFHSRRRRDSVVVGLLVLSHWLLDFVVHRPDLPLYPGGLKVGLGIWNWLWITMAVEFAVFATGLLIYVRCTVARGRMGQGSLVALVVVLMLIQLGDWFGPPPPSINAVAYAGLLQLAFVAWATWTDAHRRLV